MKRKEVNIGGVMIDVCSTRRDRLLEYIYQVKLSPSEIREIKETWICSKLR